MLKLKSLGAMMRGGLFALVVMVVMVMIEAGFLMRTHFV